MGKSLLAGFVAILLIASLLLASCSSGGSTTSAPAATSSAPTTSAPPKVYTLRYNDQNTEQFFQTAWLNKVEEVTKGAIKFEKYFTQTLSKGADAWAATRDGIADVSWLSLNYTASVTPLTLVFGLPFMSYRTSERGAEILWTLFNKYPSMQAEFKDVKVLCLFASSMSIIFSPKVQVKTMADLKGLNFRVQSGVESVTAAQLLGSSPMSLPMPDLYLALQKGTTDASVAGWEPYLNNRLYEVAKYVSTVNLWTPAHAVVMNWDK